jgi:hypothetical protein
MERIMLYHSARMKGRCSVCRWEHSWEISPENMGIYAILPLPTGCPLMVFETPKLQ